VGLLVNQVTDLITYAKSEKDYGFTLLIIAVLGLVLFGYVLTRLASTISKLLKK
jgi:small neutral amino acid transporter SnatA (MarC family)